MPGFAVGAPKANAFNGPPALVSPADAVITSVSVEFVAQTPATQTDSVRAVFEVRPQAPPPGRDFTVVVLPDSQHYSGSLDGGTPAMFRAQTDWIIAQRASRNIVFVAHVGDVTERGDNRGNDAEWRASTNALYRLENPRTTGLPEGIPYAIAPGNHDHKNGGTRFFNRYFGVDHFVGRSWYGGYFGTNNQNSFQLFSASGMDFLVVNLDYADPMPEPPVLSWANGLLRAYSNRWAIVVSHAILNVAPPPAPWLPQGRGIYNALKANPNLGLMLCGHMHGEGRREDSFQGHTVYSCLADYQSLAHGGDGWLRLYEFSPSNHVVRVRTYSPTLDRWDNRSSSRFDLPLDASVRPWMRLGTVTNVPAAGATVRARWTGPPPRTDWEWRCVVSAGTAATNSVTRRFSTEARP